MNELLIFRCAATYKADSKPRTLFVSAANYDKAKILFRNIYGHQFKLGAIVEQQHEHNAKLNLDTETRKENEQLKLL